jgi:hypothetical protein
LLEVGAGVAVDDAGLVVDGEVLLGALGDAADLVNEAGGWAAGCEAGAELHLVFLADLEDGSEFLVEQGLDEAAGIEVRADAVEHDLQTAATSEHHLGEGCEKTTV